MKIEKKLNIFIPCVIFRIKAGLGGAVMLHNLGRGPTEVATHQQRALLHCPGHMVLPLLLEGVAGAGPGAGGGAELLAGVPDTVTQPSAGEEAVQGVVVSPHHQPGQLARRGDGREEHLRGL